MLNGKRTLILSGAVHYPRTTPDAWPQIVGHAKALGLNGIETYAFWNVHEREEGQLTWEGGANLTAFVQVRSRVGASAGLRRDGIAHADLRGRGALCHRAHRVCARRCRCCVRCGCAMC